MADQDCSDVRLMPDAQAYLDAFDREADKRINDSKRDVTRQLWNRAHLKALKLAGLLAVGWNHHDPVITLEQAKWAQEVVEADVLRVIARFESGDLGHDGELASDLDKRVAIVRRTLQRYPTFDPSEQANNHMKPGMQEIGVIPHSTLRRHACSHPVFRKTHGYKNPKQLFEEVIALLLEDEVIAKVDPIYLKSQFNHRGVAYQILDTS
jgi:hypothetical protein